MRNDFLLANVADVNSEVMVKTVDDVASHAGIVLSKEQVYELAEARKEILADEEIVEMDKNSLADFIGRCAKSDFAHTGNIMDLTSEIQGIYYRCKNNWGRLLSDSTLKDLIMYGFDNICFGDTEYLESVYLEAIRFFIYSQEERWHEGDAYELLESVNSDYYIGFDNISDYAYFCMQFNRDTCDFSQYEKREFEEVLRAVYTDIDAYSDAEIEECFTTTAADEELKDQNRKWELISGFSVSVLMELFGKVSKREAGSDNTSMKISDIKDYILGIDYSIARGMQLEGLLASDNESENAHLLYNLGQKTIKDSFDNAKRLYSIVKESSYANYENYTLNADVREVGEFLESYKPEMFPQNDNVVLGYPVLASYVNLIGIEKVETFLNCIICEQKYLSSYPEKYVKSVLSKCDPVYKVSILNLFETLFRYEFETEEMGIEVSSDNNEKNENIRNWIDDFGADKLGDKMHGYIQSIIKEFNYDGMLSAYLTIAAKHYTKKISAVMKL